MQSDLAETLQAVQQAELKTESEKNYINSKGLDNTTNYSKQLSSLNKMVLENILK